MVRGASESGYERLGLGEGDGDALAETSPDGLIADPPPSSPAVDHNPRPTPAAITAAPAPAAISPCLRVLFAAARRLC
ncbi:hypothetical protein [Streptomyces sp. NPDC057877]|uniref:hypothetical protein n=1 Tax=Streptomyces sp. NPDC057877 TaxID=3346269 RepID=UPI0036831093